MTTSASSMVSSHVFSDRTAPPRAPSSVTSHSTKHTRRHRSSRSHHGGGSRSGGGGGNNGDYLPQNEFPNFAHTGDVEIVVACDGQERRYLLHRLILAQCSGFFEASTSEQWSGGGGGGDQEGEYGSSGGGGGEEGVGGVSSRPSSSSQKLSVIGEMEGSPPNMSSMQLATVARGKPFWRYELDLGSDPDDVPMLVRKENRSNLYGGGGSSSSPQPRPPPARSKPPASSAGFFRSISAMQSVVHAPSSIFGGGGGGGGNHNYSSSEPPNDTIRDYDNLFRIFYNYPPNLDSVTITEAYIQSKTLLALADMYDALEVVGPRIDHHLLQFQGRLWKQIAKYPPSYLKLGHLARSKTIFGEALTHVVGQWPAGQAQLRSVARPVLDLIEDKSDDLDELRTRLEGQLFRLTVVNSKGERAAPHPNPSSLDWLAVSLFRHWLAENLPPPPMPILAGSGTTVNPNPTYGGQKSVSFSNAHGNGNSNGNNNGPRSASLATIMAASGADAPIPVMNESVLSAGNAAAASNSNNYNNNNNNNRGANAATTTAGGAPLPPPPARSSLVPATGRAFRLLGQAGSAYLPHDELKRYLKSCLDGGGGPAYDKMQLRRFERRIDDLKLQAQAVVRPLTRNALQMDGATALGYLTCAGVGEGDWPW